MSVWRRRVRGALRGRPRPGRRPETALGRGSRRRGPRCWPPGSRSVMPMRHPTVSCLQPVRGAPSRSGERQVQRSQSHPFPTAGTPPDGRFGLPQPGRSSLPPVIGIRPAARSRPATPQAGGNWTAHIASPLNFSNPNPVPAPPPLAIPAPVQRRIPDGSHRSLRERTHRTPRFSRCRPILSNFPASWWPPAKRAPGWSKDRCARAPRRRRMTGPNFGSSRSTWGPSPPQFKSSRTPTSGRQSGWTRVLPRRAGAASEPRCNRR